MTVLQYLTNKETGCCTTSELMELSRSDKPSVETLKKWAREECAHKGIELSA